MLDEVAGVDALNVLGEKYGKERVGLYIEDGLVCFENVREPKSGKN